MTRSSRWIALAFGLLLCLSAGGALAYFLYARYRVFGAIDANSFEHVPTQLYPWVEMYGRFKVPLIVCLVIGLGLSLLAIFRKESPASLGSPQEEPVDPLAD